MTLNNRQKIGLMTLVLLSMSLVPSQTISGALSSNKTNDTEQCQQKLNEEFSKQAALTNVEKARTLASTDSHLQNIPNNEVEFGGLLHYWEVDLEKCTFKLSSVDAVFTTTDPNDGNKYNINVNEDPELKKINKVEKTKSEEIWASRNMANWAGYQIQNGGPPAPVYESHASWTVRTAYQPYSGYCITDPCKVGTWTGLSNDLNGLKLVQAVQKAEKQCSSGTTCSSTTYGLVLVYLGTFSSSCPGVDVVPGDTISAYVTNKKKTGGAVDKWDVIVYRLRSGSATLTCSDLNRTYALNGNGEPLWADYITERALKTAGNPNVYYPLAKFDPITQLATYWNGAAYKSIRVQYDLGNYYKDTMKPGAVNWVTVSDPPTTGGEFTATWLASTG